MKDQNPGRNESRTGHFHVHLLAGRSQRFVHGLTITRTVESDALPLYELWDDEGEFGPKGKRPEAPLELQEALREALRLSRQRLGLPLWPVAGAAPFDLLGYYKPRDSGCLGVLIPPLRRWKSEVQQVGEDGLPEIKPKSAT